MLMGLLTLSFIVSRVVTNRGLWRLWLLSWMMRVFLFGVLITRLTYLVEWLLRIFLLIFWLDFSGTV